MTSRLDEEFWCLLGPINRPEDEKVNEQPESVPLIYQGFNWVCFWLGARLCLSDPFKFIVVWKFDFITDQSAQQWNTKTSNCHIQYRNALYGFEFDLIFYRFLKKGTLPEVCIRDIFFLTWRWTCEASECLFLPSRAALDTVAEVLLAG